MKDFINSTSGDRDVYTASVLPESRIAKFEKVSFEQFKNDYEIFCDSSLVFRALPPAEEAYASIMLPTRATVGSSGYDIHIPFDLQWTAWVPYQIPSGIRCKILPGWMLLLMPKSGLGTRYLTRLVNTVGNIDSDYYSANNEGHMHIGLRMETLSPNVPNTGVFKNGQKIVQGVFIPYGITNDDTASGIRTGGFGSTGF